MLSRDLPPGCGVVRFVAFALLAVARPAAGQGTDARTREGTGAISGTVVAVATGRPIPEVQLSVLGTTLGGRTDDRGHFRIGAVPAGTHRVVARRIGYAAATQPATVLAGQTAAVAFELRDAALSLDAVVVVGTAAESRKKELGNAIATIETKALENEPVRNTQDLLAGRATGVTVLQNSGQPGAGGTILLRGATSLSQVNSPIMYVDGIRTDNRGTPATQSAHQGSLSINNISAEDIERIEIVKGAAATTLYGTEASGGVIQIFTKRGTTGAPRWTANLAAGANFMGHVGPASDPTGLFVNKCSGPDLRDAFGTPFVDPTCPSSGSWLQRGTVQRYSASVRGGGDALTYALSTHLDSEEGVVGPGRQRTGGVRANVGFVPTTAISFAVNSSYSRNAVQFVPDGNTGNGFVLNVARGPSNNFKGGKGECAGVTITCTTNAYILDQTINVDTDHFTSGVTTRWSPTAAFTNKLDVGFDFLGGENQTLTPFGHLNVPAGQLATGIFNTTIASASYAGSLRSSVPRVPRLVSTLSWGGQLVDERRRLTAAQANDFAGPVAPTLTSAARTMVVRDDRLRVVNAGYFVQEMLGWRDRLFLTGGVRIDGNSAFGRSYGLQAYPKLSASYVLSEERFWPQALLPTAKLRAALGASGRAPGAFDAVRTWAALGGDDGRAGVTVAQRGSPTLGPERSRELELGFDVSTPGERVGVEATAFHQRTYDALVGVQLTPSLGFSTLQLQNAGTIQNEGLELQATAALLRRDAVDWGARFSGTWLRSRVIDLGGRVIETGSGASAREGTPVGALYGRRVMNPGELAEPVVANDQFLGPTYPTRLFGVGTTLSLRRAVSITAEGEYQGGAFLQNLTAFQNASRNVWQPCYDAQQRMRLATVGADLRAGTGDEVPSAIDGLDALTRARCAIDRAQTSSDYWTAKADYFKLRSVSVSWNVPSGILRGARTATVTLAGRNLWRWTRYEGGDPESNDAIAGAGLGRVEYYQLPPHTSVVASVRTTF